VSKLPPHDLDAEAAVLGTLMLGGKDATVDEIPDLRKEHFYSGRHRHVFAAIVDLHAANEPITTIDVAARMAESGGKTPNLVGELIEMINVVPAYGARQLQAYARVVVDRSVARDLLDIARKTIATIECGIGDPGPLMAETEQEIHALAHGRGKSSWTTMNLAISGAIREMLEHHRRTDGKGGTTGVPTGFTELDQQIGGLHGGDFTVVAARPGMGKTAFVMNVAGNVVRSGWGVCVFSLEMRSEQLALRALCSAARVDMRDVRFGNLDQTEWSKLTQAGVDLCKSPAPLFIDDSGATTLPEIRSRARKAQRECERAGVKLGLVAVDYLQLVNNKSDNREQAIAEVSRAMKALAKELEVPVIALSQLNRGVEARTDKRPLLGDLRESGAIEQDADNVLMLYRDDYYNKTDSRTPGIVEIGIVKQRSGPTGTVPIGFAARTVSFRSLTAEEVAAWDDVVNPKEAIGQPRGRRRAG
jgi:replicative DNA helicase